MDMPCCFCNFSEVNYSFLYFPLFTWYIDQSSFVAGSSGIYLQLHRCLLTCMYVCMYVCGYGCINSEVNLASNLEQLHYFFLETLCFFKMKLIHLVG